MKPKSVVYSQVNNCWVLTWRCSPRKLHRFFLEKNEKWKFISVQLGFGGEICVCSYNISSLLFWLDFRYRFLERWVWRCKWILRGVDGSSVEPSFYGKCFVVLWWDLHLNYNPCPVPKIKNILCILLPWARGLLIQDPPLAPENFRHNLVTLKANIRLCNYVFINYNPSPNTWYHWSPWIRKDRRG